MKNLKNLAGFVLASMIAFAVVACSKEESHKHTFAKEWTSDATTHWHAATCEHKDQKQEQDVHTWNHEDYQYDSESGKEIRTCTECSYVADKEHQHETTTALSKDVTNHWKVCDVCGGNYEVTAHTEDTGTVTTAVTLTSDGVRTYRCKSCDFELRTEVITKPVLYESPVDAETGLAATSSSTYIYFGVFPKTVLPTDSTVTIDENVSVTMGANTYYKGSDGNYYARVKENCYSSSGYTYTDGTTVKQSGANSNRYFKVEPIKWKVLTTDYNGKALLLAEDILTANVPYYVSHLDRTIGGSTVYANNYKYSTIRAYLNGKYESDDTQAKTAYENKGFLQTAFTSAAQLLVAENAVDNSADSTTDTGNNITKATSYACANTTDKIFLLSEKEVTTSDYGFAAYSSSGKGNARIRVTTDFAKANYADQSTTAGYGCFWWLRSPCWDTSYDVRSVYHDGYAAYVSSDVLGLCFGVVPALSISF